MGSRPGLRRVTSHYGGVVTYKITDVIQGDEPCYDLVVTV